MVSTPSTHSLPSSGSFSLNNNNNNNNNSVRPNWKPDTDVNACEKCRLTFTLIRRRHHCRRCGGIFCDACSSNRRTGLPGFPSGTPPQRVCDTCFLMDKGLGEVLVNDSMVAPGLPYVPFENRPKERRVCILGHAGVGKSALLQQFTHRQFVEDYTPTIAQTQRVVLKRPLLASSNSGDGGGASLPHDTYELVIIDSAGQSSCDVFQPSLSVGTHGYVIVYSITDRVSFAEVCEIHERLRECHPNAPVLVVGNKSDLERSTERAITAAEGAALAAELSCGFLECTATKANVATAVFYTILDMIVAAEAVVC
uniref:Rheb1 n=1 Tax=Prokinetoplastina sp. TaxID=2152669 RepID=A0A2R4IKY6_9EUGL|nr:Rheb1 [Prokinetoplastina sp.]